MTSNNSTIWKKLWWAYFALSALAWSTSLFRIGSVYDAVMAVFAGYGIVGMWGYLRGLGIGWRKFWIAYLVLFVGYLLYVIGRLAWLAVQYPTGMVFYMLIATMLLCTPQCLALWRYSFRSDALWQAARVAA